MKLKTLVSAVLLSFVLGGCAMPAALTQALAEPTHPTVSYEFLLSAEDAKAIALDHAKVTAQQISGLWVELDMDDGRPEYEISFRHNNREYEYEIHGESGRILSYDREE